jgi:Skp family chaperone for outer membrane proteins
MMRALRSLTLPLPRLLTLILAALLGVALAPQAAFADSQRVAKVDAGEFPLVRIYVQAPSSSWAEGQARLVMKEAPEAAELEAIRWGAERKQGDPDSELAVPEEPSAEVGGLPVLGFADQHDPHEGRLLVFLVDGSGSMRGAGITEVRKLTRALVGRAKPEDKVAIIRFTDSSEMLLEPTSSRNAIDAALGRLDADPRGSTQIYDALGDAIQGMVSDLEEPVLPGRRFFFLFSDGLDMGSTLTAEHFQTTFQALEKPPVVYTVGVGNTTPSKLKDLELVAFFAGKKDNFFSNPGTIPLVEAFDKASAALDNQLLVEAPLPSHYHRKGQQQAVLYLRPSGGDEVALPITIPVESVPADLEAAYTSYREQIDALQQLKQGKDSTFQLIIWIVAALGLIVVVVVVVVVVSSSKKKAELRRQEQLDAMRSEAAERSRTAEEKMETLQAALTQRQSEEARRAADIARQPIAILMAVDGPLKGKRFGVLKNRVVMGRDVNKCDVVFPAEGGDSSISRVHAELAIGAQGSWQLTCLSDGGLSVGSAQLRKGERYPLQFGDHILLGKTLFAFSAP